MIADEAGYASFVDSSVSWKYIERPAFDRALDPDVYRNNPDILDIGSGPGRIISYHIDRGANTEKIVAVEPSSVYTNALQKLFSGLTIFHETAQKASFSNNSYDLVTAQLSLSYLSDGEFSLFMRKISRCLRVGGLFFMVEAHPARIALNDGMDRYFTEGEREIATPWGDTNRYHYRTLGTTLNTILRSGLHITSVDECPMVNVETEESEAAQIADYARSPARLAVLATWPG